MYMSAYFVLNSGQGNELDLARRGPTKEEIIAIGSLLRRQLPEELQASFRVSAELTPHLRLLLQTTDCFFSLYFVLRTSLGELLLLDGKLGTHTAIDLVAAERDAAAVPDDALSVLQVLKLLIEHDRIELGQFPVELLERAVICSYQKGSREKLPFLKALHDCIREMFALLEPTARHSTSFPPALLQQYDQPPYRPKLMAWLNNLLGSSEPELFIRVKAATALPEAPIHTQKRGSAAETAGGRRYQCNPDNGPDRSPGLACSFSPNGTFLASPLWVWQVKTNRYWKIWEGLPTRPDSALAWSDNSELLAVAVSSGAIVWNAATKRRCVDSLPFPQGMQPMITCLAFSPDSACLAAGQTHGHLVFWDTQTWRAEARLSALFLPIFTLTWSSSGQIAYSTPLGLHTLTKRDSSPRHVLRLAPPAVLILWSNDGEIVVWVSAHNHAVLLIPSNGMGRVHALEGHTAPVLCVSWLADGQLLTCDASGGMFVWDTITKRISARATVRDGGCTFSRVESYLFFADHLFCLDIFGNLFGFRPSEVLVAAANDNVLYVNAKVLVVGDSSAGKTGLAHRLATDQWRPHRWCLEHAVLATAAFRSERL